MRKTDDGFESFRQGLTAGHEAGQSEDLLYALGFAIGFLWGAIFSPLPAERRAPERIATSA